EWLEWRSLRPCATKSRYNASSLVVHKPPSIKAAADAVRGRGALHDAEPAGRPRRAGGVSVRALSPASVRLSFARDRRRTRTQSGRALAERSLSFQDWSLREHRCP